MEMFADGAPFFALQFNLETSDTLYFEAGQDIDRKFSEGKARLSKLKEESSSSILAAGEAGDVAISIDPPGGAAPPSAARMSMV